MTAYNEFLLTKASMDVLCELERLEQTPASEGFTLDFHHEYKSNMQAISNCIKDLNQAIKEANPSKINQCCDKGIKLCEDFRAKVKALPPDKFKTVNNLMPFFIMALTVFGIISTFGISLKSFNLPDSSTDWVNHFADMVLDTDAALCEKDKDGNPIDAMTRNDLVKLGAMKKNHSDKWEPGKFPVLDIAGNIAGFFTSHNGLAMKIAMAAPQVKVLIDRIMNFTKECKYAKMIRDEDRFDPNAGNRKYAATLGQIDDTIDMFKATKSKARELAGNVKASMIETKNAQEAILFSPQWKRERLAAKQAKAKAREKATPFYRRSDFIGDTSAYGEEICEAATKAAQMKIKHIELPSNVEQVKSMLMSLSAKAEALVRSLPEYKAYLNWADSYIANLDEADQKDSLENPRASSRHPPRASKYFLMVTSARLISSIKTSRGISLRSFGHIRMRFFLSCMMPSREAKSLLMKSSSMKEPWRSQ